MSQMNMDFEGSGLHRKARENRFDIVRALMASGDDVYARDKDNPGSSCPILKLRASKPSLMANITVRNAIFHSQI